MTRHLFDADPMPLLRRLGLHVVAGRCFCPLCQPAGPPKHKTPDMTFNRGVKCFRCGFRGSETKLVEEVCRVDWKEAQRIVYAAYGMAEDTGAKAAAFIREAQAKKPRQKRKFPTLEAALAYPMERDGWKIGGAWKYSDRLVQTRYDTPDGKTFRPYYMGDDGKWRNEAGPAPWPLYRGVGYITSVCVTYVVEGEKCVDAMRRIGLAACTSLNGARGAGRSDWSGVAGDVIVIRDNDEAGLEYAKDVRAILEKQGCRVRVAVIPGEEGYDVADLIADNPDIHPANIKEYVHELAKGS